MKQITFIDLFAWLGGTRIGFEMACKEKKIIPKCVFTSEIKKSAIQAYQKNFNNEKVFGDITQIDIEMIPDFDYLLGWFPCQPFSSAGSRKWFLDKRWWLFFTIFDILKEKKPKWFLLENVEWLLNHDNWNTLEIMISSLKSLWYNVDYKLLDASEFWVAQKRKRVYIVWKISWEPQLKDFIYSQKYVKDSIDEKYEFEESDFSKKILKIFSYKDLWWKNIKDKRWWKHNIHSWEIWLKWEISQEQKELLNEILKKRRNKIWAEKKWIKWMDGMPLTKKEIETFYNHEKLQEMLDDLVEKKYLTLEHPKDEVIENWIKKRKPKITIEKWYNIVAWKLSFPLSHILNPNGFAPTIVATEIWKIWVATKKWVRPITIKEWLSISWFPDHYNLSHIDYASAFDLIWNTVMPPVIKQVALKII